MKRDVQASAQPPTKVMHRQLHRLPPIATGGRGAWITDAEGKRYLDASGGAAVSCLGHGHPDVLAAMRAQMDAIAYAHTGFFTTDVAETLADTLVASAPRASLGRTLQGFSPGADGGFDPGALWILGGPR